MIKTSSDVFKSYNVTSYIARIVRKSFSGKFAFIAGVADAINDIMAMNVY